VHGMVILRPSYSKARSRSLGAEEALGTFYVHRHRTQEAREGYERLLQLWQKFPESNEYLDNQRTVSQRLLFLSGDVRGTYLQSGCISFSALARNIFLSASCRVFPAVSDFLS
jgi:hypothetical protein